MSTICEAFGAAMLGVLPVLALVWIGGKPESLPLEPEPTVLECMPVRTETPIDYSIPYAQRRIWHKDSEVKL